MSEGRRMKRGEEKKTFNENNYQEGTQNSQSKFQMIKRTTYLHETQTTDCTKSSTDIRNLRMKGLE